VPEQELGEHGGRDHELELLRERHAQHGRPGLLIEEIVERTGVEDDPRQRDRL